MRLLVFGAGVLGSLYAARLKEAGHDVTILARGDRADDVRRHGIVLEDEKTGRRTETVLPVITELAPEDRFECVLVIVRREQLAAALPQLAANRSPAVLFMTNNAGGTEPLTAALGQERVLLGFPAAGGAREGHVVRYSITGGKTTLGELSGRVTPRLQAIAGALEAAGFATAFSPNMDAWLKTHAVMVSPIAGAFYYAGDNYKLAESAEGLRLLIAAVREGLRALSALGIPIEPGRARILRWVPAWFLRMVLRRALATRRAELLMWRHAQHARAEMQFLAGEVRRLLRRAGFPTPASDRLYGGGA
jgi:2-dehydropantoate 2-reductase